MSTHTVIRIALQKRLIAWTPTNVHSRTIQIFKLQGSTFLIPNPLPTFSRPRTPRLTILGFTAAGGSTSPPFPLRPVASPFALDHSTVGTPNTSQHISTTHFLRHSNDGSTLQIHSSGARGQSPMCNHRFSSPPSNPHGNDTAQPQDLNSKTYDMTS